VQIHVPHRPTRITLFLLLAFLCYQGHQLTRHIVGAALCGGFGSMTFAVTITHQPCSLPVAVILSGPIFTYGLAYMGMALLQSPRRALFAYALIFASFAHLRWIQTLTGRGDELLLAGLWSAAPSRIIVAATVFLIGIPPIWAAFHAIANPRRWRTFIISYLLPLPLLFILLFGNRLLFGENGNEVTGPLVVGIPLIVLAVDITALVLFIIFLPRGLREQEGA
jgi:hypothetical protein